MKFELGQTVMTRGIADAMEESKDFAKEVHKALERYTACDWGELDEEDSEMNNSAVQNNDDRILAKYDTSEGAIYIITEWDRSVTTILFTDEY